MSVLFPALCVLCSAATALRIPLHPNCLRPAIPMDSPSCANPVQSLRRPRSVYARSHARLGARRRRRRCVCSCRACPRGHVCCRHLALESFQCQTCPSPARLRSWPYRSCSTDICPHFPHTLGELDYPLQNSTLSCSEYLLTANRYWPPRAMDLGASAFGPATALGNNASSGGAHGPAR